MQYGEMAAVYDTLMKRDVDYAKWCDYIENLFGLYGIEPDIVCDLACGTGNITNALAGRGYSMIGVDISPDMLSTARAKAAECELDVLYIGQDMTRLDLYGTAGAFLCMIDGINYIIDPHRTQYMFSRIKKCFLDPGGVFIFDISTRFKLENVIGSNTFSYDDGNVFYYWENKYLKKQKLSKMELTFFRRNKDGSYRRFDERHIQRAYTAEELCAALERAGFEHIDVYGELSFEKPRADAERIVIAAR